MVRGRPATPGLRQGITNNLTNGRPASGGEPIYDETEEVDITGKPTGKKTQTKRLDPKTGTAVTTPRRPAVQPFEEPIAAAATEQAMFGYVTTPTVRKLQQLGYSVNQIPGLKTESQYRKSRPRRRVTVRSNPDQRAVRPGTDREAESRTRGRSEGGGPRRATSCATRTSTRRRSAEPRRSQGHRLGHAADLARRQLGVTRAPDRRLRAVEEAVTSARSRTGVS